MTIADSSSTVASMSWTRTREFVRYNLGWALVLAAIVLVSPFVGLLIAGAWGILVGLLLGLLSVPVGYRAITKVHDNLRGGDQ